MLQEMLERVRARQRKLNRTPDADVAEGDDLNADDVTSSRAINQKEPNDDDDDRTHVKRPPGDDMATEGAQVRLLTSADERHNAHGDFGSRVEVGFTNTGISVVDITGIGDRSTTTSIGGAAVAAAAATAGRISSGNRKTEMAPDAAPQSSRAFLLGTRDSAARQEGVASGAIDYATAASVRHVAATEIPVQPAAATAAAGAPASAASAQVTGYADGRNIKSRRSNTATVTVGGHNTHADADDVHFRSLFSNDVTETSSPSAFVRFKGNESDDRDLLTPLSLGFVSSGSSDDDGSLISLSDTELRYVRTLASQSARHQRRLKAKTGSGYRYGRPVQSASSAAVGGRSYERRVSTDSLNVRFAGSVLNPTDRVSTGSRPISVEVSPDLNGFESHVPVGRRLRNALNSASSHRSRQHASDGGDRRRHTTTVVGVLSNPSVVKVSRRPRSAEILNTGSRRNARSQPSAAAIGNPRTYSRNDYDGILAVGYFSDPENGGHRSAFGVNAYSSNGNLYRSSLLNIGSGGIYNVAGSTAANVTPGVALPIMKQQRDIGSLLAPLYVFPVETEPQATNGNPESVNPQLEDVGKLNGSYFVQMKLNAASGGGVGMTVTGGNLSGASTSAGSSSGVAGAVWYQPNNGVGDSVSRSDFRHVSLASQAYVSPSNGGNDDTGHGVRRSVDDLAKGERTRSGRRQQPYVAGVAVGQQESDRCSTNVGAGNYIIGPVSAAAENADKGGLSVRQVPVSTVNFDIELQSVADKLNRLNNIDATAVGGYRPLSSINHTNNMHPLSSSFPSPRYSLRLNDTMTFDFDAGGQHGNVQRQNQRRHARRRRRRSDDEDGEVSQHSNGVEDSWTHSSVAGSTNHGHRHNMVGDNRQQRSPHRRNIPIQVTIICKGFLW